MKTASKIKSEASLSKSSREKISKDKENQHSNMISQAGRAAVGRKIGLQIRDRIKQNKQEVEVSHPLKESQLIKEFCKNLRESESTEGKRMKSVSFDDQ
jgi:hypothetical protein